MLKELIPKARAFLLGSVVLAVAAGVTVIAAAYGLYAVLRIQLSAPACAGITAVVFAVVAVICAVSLTRVFSSKGEPAHEKKHPVRSPEAVQIGMEAGLAVMGLVADMLVSRRTKRREAEKSKRRRR